MLPAPPFQLLERYDVVEEIGRGGHAVVFRAHDRQLARDVAIKVLREDVVGSADVVKRFMQEIQLLATLEHAHILHVHDSGTVDGQPFVVMELAPQATLARRLTREAQLPIADAVQIAREVGSALAHAHARGILHRDVKPENILLGAGGAVLADFGIARVTGEHDISRITSTGEAVGTLQYMSPEQLCAEPIDARSDQYALGLVFYEMLSGVRPHAAPTIDALRALRVTGQHVALSVYRSAVSPALEAIIARMMAVAPADRFRSLDEFLMALSVLGTAESPTGSGGYEVVRTPSGSRPAVGTPSAGVSAPVSVANDARKKRWVVASAIVATLVTGVSITQWANARGDDGAPATPGALVVRLASPGDSLSERVRARVRDELAAWSGVEVRDGGRGGVQVSTTVTRLDDSVQVRLQVRDSAGAAPRDVRRMIATRALDSATGVTASMTREILAGRSLDSLRGLDGIPTRSLPALRSYVRGFDLLYDGQLDSASAAFRAARDAAPGFAAAHLWAAQSAAWAKPREVAAWQPDVAAALRSGVPDSGAMLLVRGLDRMARREFPGACAVYREAERFSEVRFEALMGLGECQRLDDLVMRTPAGLRFRSSHWGALQAYLRAVDIAHSSELLAAILPQMKRMTYAVGAQVRFGSALSERFLAYPAMISDTLAFVPIPMALANSGDPSTIPISWATALRRGRSLEVELTSRWTRRFPTSFDAKFERAISLEAAGHIGRSERGGAQESLEDAKRLGAPRGQAGRVALVEIRLAVRRGEFDEANRLARVALSDTSIVNTLDHGTTAALAALIGDPTLLEGVWVDDSSRVANLNNDVRNAMARLEQLDLVGDCGAAQGAHVRLEELFRAHVQSGELAQQRLRWLKPLLQRAVPCLGVNAIAGFPADDSLDHAVSALARGRAAESRASLQRLFSRRVGALTGAVSWDYQFLESWLLAAAGDTTAAMSHLLDGFDGIAEVSVSTFAIPAQAAGLRRSLSLLRALAADARTRARLSPLDRRRLSRLSTH